MEKQHVISDGLFNEAQHELSRGNPWIAFNNNNYFLDNKDMYFFSFEEEAKTFAVEYSNPYESYRVLQANSIISLMRQLPYGQDIHFNLRFEELESLFQSFDWNVAIYDPQHDAIEAMSDSEMENLVKMETLLVEWENLYRRNPEAALELTATYWEGKPMEYFKNNFITINNDIMNEKNLSYLEGNLLYAGFGDQLNEQLKVAINKQEPEFTLKLETEVNKAVVKAELYFKRSKEPDSDMYFFNKYDVQLKTDKEGQDLSQTFYINKGHGITLKEAYNLLNGRSVHTELQNKEGEKYTAWVKVDFSEKNAQGNFKLHPYNENYGYNVVEALSKYPIKELQDEKQKEDLIKSMQKGNLQMVTFEKNGVAEKLYVEANPQFKSINVYDTKTQRIEKQVLAEKYGQGVNGRENRSASQSSKQEGKQGSDDETAADPKKKENRRKSQGIS